MNLGTAEEVLVLNSQTEEPRLASSHLVLTAERELDSEPFTAARVCCNELCSASVEAASDVESIPEEPGLDGDTEKGAAGVGEGEWQAWSWLDS